MTLLNDDPLLFENDEWAVTEAGLEHRRTGYFIGAEQLGERRPDGLWSWPIHMAEKSWCAPEAFSEAFMHALAACGLQPDADLARSFAAAGRRTTHRAVWDHVARDVVGRDQGAPLSLGEVMTISSEMDRRTGLGNRTGLVARRARRRGDRWGRVGARFLEWLRGGYGPESERISS
jgi:hypothetical protein